MRLSIVVVNYRGWKRLRPCLESLRCLNGASFKWEIVVVDNRSDDGVLPSFIRDFPEFAFVENTGNHGFSHGCNCGARRTTGDFLFFLNPDTVLTREAAEQLLQTACRHPEIAILTCRQVNDRGADTKPYGVFPRPATFTRSLRLIHKLTHGSLPAHTLDAGVEVVHPEWVSGSAIWISRDRFNTIGGWDEDFWMYSEDVDLCRRVRKTGGEIALLASVQIVHNHGGASRANPDVKALTKTEVLISKHVYLHKHFRGAARSFMQVTLVVSNLLLGPLLMALVGLLGSWKASMRVYPALYRGLVRYYAGAWKNRTWISPRSVNYRPATGG